jgi:gas vesicle protein
MHKENGGGGFAAGFLLGALVGGIAAIVLAQEETRDLLVGKAKEAGERVSDMTSQWQAGASELYERGRQVVEQARSTIDAAVAEGISSAQQSREELQKQAEG